MTLDGLIANDHYRRMAEDLILRNDEVFIYLYIDGESGPDNHGIYKCGLCGEAGTFIGSPTHIRDNPDSLDDGFGLTDVQQVTQTFWCAGRPDLRQQNVKR